jgi:CGNR zinc finger
MDLLRSYGLIQFVKGSYRSTLRRLKICAAPDCDIAFYDISKNCSKQWHDVATCGNAHNARAYRQRKKSAADEAGDGGLASSAAALAGGAR